VRVRESGMANAEPGEDILGAAYGLLEEWPRKEWTFELGQFIASCDLVLAEGDATLPNELAYVEGYVCFWKVRWGGGGRLVVHFAAASTLAFAGRLL